MAMNATCDPILDMRLSQQQLKEMFERNKQLAQLNPEYRMGYAESNVKHDENPVLAKKPVFLTGMTQAKPSKYRNVKVEYDGMKFDSKHELECWKNLKLREKAGEISLLERQVSYDLVVNGIKIGRFTADFTWLEHHQVVVADAKSPATRKETAYRLRKKIWEAQYAPLVIREL